MSRVISREQLINKLEKAYPEMKCMLSEDFSGSEGGVWVSGEDGITDRDGLEIFKYWNEDYEEKFWTMGIRNHLRNFLQRNGWYCEWQDAGTIIIWEI